MSKIFFDTNILLDILIEDRPNHAMATKVLIDVGERYTYLVTSENILTTLEYVAGRNSIPCIRIASFFQMIQKSFIVLNFSDIIKAGISLYATHCQSEKRLDFEDALQLLCAIEADCDVFLTEDRGIAKLNPEIKVATLDDFL